MTNERKNISQPSDWWEAFEQQAKSEGKTLSAWMAEKCISALPKKVANKLSERVREGRPNKQNNADSPPA